MTPIEWVLRPIKRYSDFTGRAPRAEYWRYYLLTLVLGLMTYLIDFAVGALRIVTAIVNLALFLPWLSVTVRRLRNTDRSGWWLPLFILAAVALKVIFILNSRLIVFASTANAFTAATVAIIFLICLVFTFLAFMVLSGTRGPNRYGPDPYGHFIPYVGSIVAIVFMCIPGTRGPNRFGRDPYEAEDGYLERVFA